MFQEVDVRLLTLSRILASLTAVAVAALVACSVAPQPTASTPRREPTTTPVSTTIVETTPSPSATPTEPRPTHITLTVWGPIQFSPGETDSGRSVLQAQYEDFAADNEGIGVEYVPKAPYGESGVVDFLVTASYAAPGILPDLAIVDTVELETLVKEGLAQPLDGQVADALTADLYPFASGACTFNGELRGIQFEADIEHLIYYTKVLEEPPATWAELFSGPISYTFPAGGDNGLVNDSFLIQYLAQDGRLTDQEGNPALDSSPLQRVLRMYDALRIWNVSPPKIRELASLEDCWKVYTEGNITVSHVSSWRYLTSRPVMQDTSFAPIPTENGIPATMARGWAFVIVTASPYRQEAATRLIEWLMTPQNLAQWSEASNHLPVRPSALRLTGWPLEYTRFLDTQLANAFYRPSTTEFEKVGRALQVAVQDVLSGEQTPRQATTQAIESLQ
jgi:ABC-type glycerol-3-phosphate transport system substrate-binding protein